MTAAPARSCGRFRCALLIAKDILTECPGIDHHPYSKAVLIEQGSVMVVASTQEQFGLRARLIAVAVAVAALLAVFGSAPPGAQALTSNWCGTVIASGTRCFESGTAHTWAYAKATHPGGTAPSLCAYLTADSTLTVTAFGSGCLTSVSTYSVCYGVSPTYWLAMVEQLSGSSYTVNGYANTAACS
jgi:hypothetical protein